MLILQGISYTHPNKDLLFNNVSFTVNNQDKVAIIGNNGVGKSTLLKIIANELQPMDGQIRIDVNPYYVPQIFGQYNHLTIAQVLGIEQKLTALKRILDGETTEANFEKLDEDWTIEERCHQAFGQWQLGGLNLQLKLETLSGGQKTKLALAGITLHRPSLILLDEPSNHLDSSGRRLLYEFVESAKSTLVVVSHDRKLLNRLPRICELTNQGIKVYGGNYDFYSDQKQIENTALSEDILNKERSLRIAKEKERETVERQQKLNSRGKAKQEKAGVATIMMNTLRNKAENSTANLKNVHALKIKGISEDLHDLRAALAEYDKMKFDFDNSTLHRGKILFRADGININFNGQTLWDENMNVEIRSGERIAIKGDNGSGKTTLIKIILGNLEPNHGAVYRAENRSVYVDQDYSLIDNSLNVYNQAQHFNYSGLLEHEIKIILTRFLFDEQSWEKPCNDLSGGERMRLVLCCLVIGKQSPDIIILDEPTNNLDIQNIEILTAAISDYQGTLIVVSHDEMFLDKVNIKRTIDL